MIRKAYNCFRIVAIAVLAVVWALVQIPTLLSVAPFCRRFAVRQMRFFMRGAAMLFRIRLRAHGQMSDRRPLLLVANHISIFEIVAFPAIFGNAFFSKREVLKWPILGWYIKAFGNAFLDRRPSHAAEGAANIRRQLRAAKNPFAVFPEGTTNNGDYVLPFKGGTFDFAADADVKIQPVAILYRDKRGNKIDPQILADEYAYFSNAKQTQGPFAARELSIIGLVWKNLVRGGFVFEAHILPAFDPKGLDRKEIAAALYEIVSKKFQELK